MAIVGYKAPRREVTLSGGEPFQVKGLTLTDISVLIDTHFGDMDALVELFTAQRVDLSLDNIKSLAASIVAQAPGFAANLIALGAGEPDAAPTIQNEFGAGTQINAIMEIGNLTFAEVGGVKKGLEQIVALLANNRKVLTKAVKKKAG